MKHLIFVVVLSLCLPYVVGCQVAPDAALAEAKRVRVLPVETDERIERVGQRVHVLLARASVDPVSAEQPVVPMRAGDMLGDQMFLRYAAQVRDQQRQEEPMRLVRADALAWLARFMPLMPQ